MIRSARSLASLHRIYPRCRRGMAGITPQLPAQPKDHLPSSQSPIVSQLQFFNSVTGQGGQIPTYRVLDGVGNTIEGAEIPEVCAF
jgi:2-oxoisovalerate dehydrogenase E1 component alpha subunit